MKLITNRGLVPVSPCPLVTVAAVMVLHLIAFWAFMQNQTPAKLLEPQFSAVSVTLTTEAAQRVSVDGLNGGVRSVIQRPQTHASAKQAGVRSATSAATSAESAISRSSATLADDASKSMQRELHMIADSAAVAVTQAGMSPAQSVIQTSIPSNMQPNPGPAERERTTQAVSPPRFDADYLSNPAPDYPQVSRRLGEQGTVVLDVLVSREGAVLEVRTQRSSGYARLDIAALKAVSQWRFIPAQRGGANEQARVLVPMVFSLRTR